MQNNAKRMSSALHFRVPRQTFLVMKITTLLLLITIMTVSASTLAQKITLNEKNASLEQVLNKIRQQSGYDFVYSEDLFTNAPPITITLKDATLEEALQASLKNQALTFLIENNAVVFKAKEENLLDKYKVFFDPITVTGRVTDETGQPLAGVTVKIKATGSGTATGLDGSFRITVPNDREILTFTYVGHEKEEILARDVAKSLTVVMKSIATNLQEIVINKGYYSVKEELNTGNVTVVKGDDIAKQVTTDPILALSGQVPGLYIQQTSGVPGSYAKISIRGQNSIANGNDPLYIVDGVPFSSISLSSSNGAIGPVGNANSNFNSAGNGLSPFNGLNPADIENIEILKDADATAIYGSRGANGVVLITTKKGKAGDTRVDFNVYTGAGQVGHMMQLLNTQQYLQMRKEAFKNDGLIVPSIVTKPTDNNYDINGVWDTTRYTNWQKVFIGGTAQFTNAQGSISGGNANTQFYIGGGYSTQGTVFPGNYTDQKASAHINLTHNSADHRFSTQFAASYVADNNILPSVNFAANIITAPDAPALYDNNGNVNWAIYNGAPTFLANPAGVSLRTASSRTNNLVSNFLVKYELLPGLDLKSSFGYNRDEMNQNQLTPATSVNPTLNPITSRDNIIALTSSTSWIIEPNISYQKKLGKGNLNILLGSTFQDNQYSTITTEYNGFTSDALITNPQSASTITVYGSNNVLYHYTALYGRIGYNWDDKYLLNLTARRDGSSRFGPGKQFGNFGAIGGAWIFSKEKWAENKLSFLSFGKLRASYGTSGNDQIIDYQWLSTYSPTTNTYQGINGLTPSRIANPDYAWEMVKKLEAGLELGFLRDRLNVQLSYYQNRTGNQLVGFPLPILAGFNTVQYNLPAVVQNTGLEILLNTINLKSKNFEWTTNLNGTLPNNKLVAFPNLANYPQFNTIYQVGQSLSSRNVLLNTGVNPQTGLYSFVTSNANGVPSVPADDHFIKPVTQRFYGGVENKLTYKGVTLDFLVQYVNQYSPGYLQAFSSMPGTVNYNQPIEVLTRWQVPGDVTSIQRYSTAATAKTAYNNFKGSDGTFADASFVRLKNVVVSWELPITWSSKLHIRTTRIYFQGQNVFTLTNYKGLDPETAGSLSLPPLRMLTAGMQIGI
ncbi:SusC/RagA family TonB-linked outer membrane protein [Mucilaginibacter sp. AW1-3]